MTKREHLGRMAGKETKFLVQIPVSDKGKKDE